MMNFEGMNCLVVGAGRSGRAAAALLARHGARVRVIDRRPVPPDPRWGPEVEFQAGIDAHPSLAGIDLVVPSPGVPAGDPLLRDAVAHGVRVWSELELSARLFPAPVLAVTGTNGKSTTTVLLGAMLAGSGSRVFVGGNLGVPLAEALLEEAPYDLAVLEVSSFQLEWVESFRARVAVWLNLTEDHLDRHGTMAAYAAAKARLLDGQHPGDTAVLNRDDPWVWRHRDRVGGDMLSFGGGPVEAGCFVDRSEVVACGRWGAFRFPLAECSLGEAGAGNVQAAVAAALAWGVSPSAIDRALREVRSLPHRLERVAVRRGVIYVDDSKATNPGAVRHALQVTPLPVILLLGGLDKGGDFASLSPLLRRAGSRAVCFGADGLRIAEQLGPEAVIAVTRNLTEAVRVAVREATPGTTVLLSPGCASFDEFRDYAQRGEHFRRLVGEL